MAKNTKTGRRKRAVVDADPKLALTARCKRFIWTFIRFIATQLRRLANLHPLFYRAIGATVIGAPPMFVANYYQIEKFADEWRRLYPSLTILLDNHVLLFCIAGGVWVFFILECKAGLMSLAADTPPGWHLTPYILLKSINNIVGAKEQRFSKYIAELDRSKEKPNKAEIFASITQPVKQIGEIVHGIYASFDLMLRNTMIGRGYQLKVNLALMDPDSKIQTIMFHYPNDLPVRSSVAELNSPNSSIRVASKSRNILIINSTRAESLKAVPSFKVTNPAYSEEDGSLICYPVTLDGVHSVVFVISVFVNVPDTFKSKHRDAFNEVFLPFALRLKLEYALLLLRERAT